MKKSRVWTATIAAAAFAIGGLGGAVPATAAVTGNVAVSGSGSVSVTWSGGATAWDVQGNGDVINVCAATAILSGCGNPMTGNIGYIKLTGGSTSIVLTENTDITERGTLTTRSLGAGTYTIQMIQLNPSGPATVIGNRFSVSIGGSNGGNGSSSSDANTNEPVEVSLSLDLAASSASCKEGSAATGVMGAWMYLPAADDCSSTTNPDAKLLGWSTSANFPVERAQSQVDNRWGAIDEVFDGVRMIFIPAGQATFVSGPNSLHPIWAS